MYTTFWHPIQDSHVYNTFVYNIWVAETPFLAQHFWTFFSLTHTRTRTHTHIHTHTHIQTHTHTRFS